MRSMRSIQVGAVHVERLWCPQPGDYFRPHRFGSDRYTSRTRPAAFLMEACFGDFRLVPQEHGQNTTSISCEWDSCKDLGPDSDVRGDSLDHEVGIQHRSQPLKIMLRRCARL